MASNRKGMRERRGVKVVNTSTAVKLNNTSQSVTTPKNSKSARDLEAAAEQALLNTQILERERRAARPEGRLSGGRALPATQGVARAAASLNTGRTPSSEVKAEPLQEHEMGARHPVKPISKQPSEKQPPHSATPSATPDHNHAHRALTGCLLNGHAAGQGYAQDRDDAVAFKFQKEGESLPLSAPSGMEQASGPALGIAAFGQLEHQRQSNPLPGRYDNLEKSILVEPRGNVIDVRTDSRGQTVGQVPSREPVTQDPRALRDHFAQNLQLPSEPRSKHDGSRSPSKENRYSDAKKGARVSPPRSKLHLADDVGNILKGSIPSPASPVGVGSGGRKFMSAMSELRPGFSDEQRRHAEEQRRRLREDLEEQVRQKNEEKKARKAADLAAEQREEEQLQAYYSNLARTSPARMDASSPHNPGATGSAAAHSMAGKSYNVHDNPQWSAEVTTESTLSNRPGAPDAHDPGLALPLIPHKPHGEYAALDRQLPGLLHVGQQSTLLGTAIPLTELKAPDSETVGHAQLGPRPAARLEPLASSSAPNEVVELLEQLRNEQAALREQCAQQAAALERIQTSSDGSSRRESEPLGGLPPLPLAPLDELESVSQLVPASLNHIPADPANIPEPPPLMAGPAKMIVPAPAQPETLPSKLPVFTGRARAVPVFTGRPHAAQKQQQGAQIGRPVKAQSGKAPAADAGAVGSATRDKRPSRIPDKSGQAPARKGWAR